MARFFSGWRYHPLRPDAERLLEAGHGLSPVAARVLAARGITGGLAQKPPAWLALPYAPALPVLRRIVERLGNRPGPVAIAAAPDPDSLLAARVFGAALGPERARLLMPEEDAAPDNIYELLFVFAPLAAAHPVMRTATGLPETIVCEVVEPVAEAAGLRLAASLLPDPWRRLAPAGLAFLLGLAWRFRDAPWAGKRIVVYDIETTGLSPEQDRVIEVAAQAIVDGEVVGRYASLCRIGQPLPAKITALTGITDADLIDAPPEAEALAGFVDFLDGADFLSGHNCTDFDNRFILARTKALGIPFRLPPLLDTLHLSRRNLRGLVNHKLATVAAALGFGGSGYHRAEADVEATAHCLLRLLLLAHAPCRELIAAVGDELCLAGALPDSGPGNRALSALGRMEGSKIANPVRAWITLGEACIKGVFPGSLTGPLSGDPAQGNPLLEGDPPYERDKAVLQAQLVSVPDGSLLILDGPRPLSWLALLAYALPLRPERVHGLLAPGNGGAHLVLASFAEARLARAVETLAGRCLGAVSWPGMRLLVLSEADCAAAVETAIGGSLQEPAVLEFEARYAADNPDLPHVLAGLPDLAPWSPGFPGPVLLLEQVARDMLRHGEDGLMIELPGLLSRIVLPPGRALPEGDGALDLVLAWRGGGLGTFTSRLLDVRLSPLWEGG